MVIIKIMLKLFTKISSIILLSICIVSCVLLDTEKPVLTIIDPAENIEEIDQLMFLISGTASDDVGLISVEIRIDDNEYLAVEGLDEWNYLAVFTETDLGPHYFTIKAKDSSNNESFIYKQFTLIEKKEVSAATDQTTQANEQN